MDDAFIHNLELAVSQEAMPRFATLLQWGVVVPSDTGTTVGHFICNLPGFDANYLATRVQTIFFDGSAIDDLDQPFRRDRHTLALSASLPGLAGAIFRKNSTFAALRSTTGGRPNTDTASQTSLIRLKLFNAIAMEKGEGLLRAGGIFPGRVLRSFFADRPALASTILSCTLDSSEQEADPLSFLQPENDYRVAMRTGHAKERP